MKDTVDLIIEDWKDRKEHGIKKYGVALNPNNGRDNLKDLYEELMDACAYIKNEMRERENGS